VLKVATSSAAAAAAAKLAEGNAWASAPTRIVRDVCVIGGGSSGTYAAVRLRNLGKSVVVLEKESRLGGHAQTVSVNGVPVDIGVQEFESLNPLVTSYCAQLNVPLTHISLTGGPPAINADFRTGAPVALPPLDPVAFGTALGTYLQILQTEFPYLDSGFNLPNPVPPDLLLPFGEFVTKYGLQAIASTAAGFAEGFGDVLGQPALYVLKLFGLSVAGALATDTFAMVPTGTGTIYDAAAAFLGKDAVVNACVLAALRTEGGVEVLAETPDGPVLVQAEKLVFAIPPTLPNIALVIPDARELSLFSRFGATYYATSLLQVGGLGPGVAVDNVGADTPYNIPALPGMYLLQPTAVPGYYVGQFGNTTWLPDAVAKAEITASVERLSRGIPGLKFGSLDTFSSHAPFHMTVSAHDIAAGFYSKLNALQGHNRTFYTGAAFQTNDSSLIWRFTEELLPQILA
jgi:hypothetical protein